MASSRWARGPRREDGPHDRVLLSALPDVSDRSGARRGIREVAADVRLASNRRRTPIAGRRLSVPVVPQWIVGSVDERRRSSGTPGGAPGPPHVSGLVALERARAGTLERQTFRRDRLAQAR